MEDRATSSIQSTQTTEGPRFTMDTVHITVEDNRGNRVVLTTERVFLSTLRDAADARARADRESAKKTKNAILYDADTRSAAFMERVRDACTRLLEGVK